MLISGFFITPHAQAAGSGDGTQMSADTTNALAAIVGVIAKSVEAVQWLTFVLVFPLTFASSAFVPTEGMNKYLKAFAENQPITQVIEAVRALILGAPIGNHGWLAVGWSLLLLVVAVPIATRLFAKKSV